MGATNKGLQIVNFILLRNQFHFCDIYASFLVSVTWMPVNKDHGLLSFQVKQALLVSPHLEPARLMRT